MPFALWIQPWVFEFRVQVVAEVERLLILPHRFHNPSRHFKVTTRAFIVTKVPRINLDVWVKMTRVWCVLVRPVVVQLQLLALNGQTRKFCRAQKGRFHILHGIVYDPEPCDEKILLFPETQFFINLQFLYYCIPLATYKLQSQ